jgi:hypothetical protein
MKQIAFVIVALLSLTLIAEQAFGRPRPGGHGGGGSRKSGKSYGKSGRSNRKLGKSGKSYGKAGKSIRKPGKTHGKSGKIYAKPRKTSAKAGKSSGNSRKNYGKAGKSIRKPGKTHGKSGKIYAKAGKNSASSGRNNRKTSTTVGKSGKGGSSTKKPLGGGKTGGTTTKKSWTSAAKPRPGVKALPAQLRGATKPRGFAGFSARGQHRRRGCSVWRCGDDWFYWCPQFGCYCPISCIDDYPPDDSVDVTEEDTEDSSDQQ